jgi:hypothetical protein
MATLVTTMKKGSNVSLGSNLKKWMEYISNYPNQCPMGVRLNTYGILHIGDISVHLAIRRLMVRNPLEEPKFGPVPKFLQDERKRLKREHGLQGNAFIHVAIWVLAQEGYFAAQVHTLAIKESTSVK